MPKDQTLNPTLMRLADLEARITRLERPMTEQEARNYLSDLAGAGAARATGIRTARAEYNPTNGYRVWITDMAIYSKRRDDPTYEVPAPWTPVLHERNATWYVCPDLLAAQEALGFTPESDR